MSAVGVKTELKPGAYKTGLKPVWCPGCGDYSILAQMKKMLPPQGLPRENIVFIADEAHRSQYGFDARLVKGENEAYLTYGFAKYLHDSLPNATYVGFTGTPIDATLDVFGEVVDSYTMTESVKDAITIPIVYEGRAAKVILDNTKLEEIEEGTSDIQRNIIARLLGL